LEDVKALEAHLTFQDAVLLKDIEAAIKKVKDMSDQKHTRHHITHHGSGPLKCAHWFRGSEHFHSPWQRADVHRKEHVFRGVLRYEFQIRENEQ
jgi:hypothetical protein